MDELKSSKLVAPRVVHLTREPYDVRIDRTSHWGNPFVIGKDGTRAQVIEKYTDWICAPEQRHMVRYARKVLAGKTLGCWCAPKPCHGDVLLELANTPWCEKCEAPIETGFMALMCPHKEQCALRPDDPESQQFMRELSAPAPESRDG